MYTVLLLQPKGFPIKPTHPWYHMVKVGYSFQEVLRSNTKIEAELFCIIAGLVTIVRRWGDLDEYLGELLVEDFMHPDEYVKLLFDDGNFTRSQEYFWAIGALNEFGVLITENISQWDLYYEGRIQNLLQMKNLAYLFDAACLMKPDNTTAEQNGRKRLREFKDLIKKGEVQREALVELQARFERKLETIKALRDGVRIPIELHYSPLTFTALQRQRSARKQSIDPPWRECEATHICQHLLPPPGILCCKSTIISSIPP